MANSLVSIIVPVFNTETYLRDCIESVLSQTYLNIRLYLIDDGSTDTCPEICDYFATKDDRVVVIHKKNEGQGVARNVALDLIDSGYIAFVDSDDYISKDMIDTMVSQLEKTGSDMAICGTEFHGIQTKRLGEMPDSTVLSNDELILAYLSLKLYIGAVMWNKLYKADLFDGVRFPSFRASEDSYLLPEIFRKCRKSVHVGKCLYIQNVRNNSTELSKFSEKNLVSLTVSDKLMHFVDDYYPQYYHFVAAKKINKIASLMMKIKQGFVYRKYKDVYKDLENQLNKEYPFVNEKYPQSIKRITRIAAEHKHIFGLICFYSALRYYFGNMLRKHNRERKSLKKGR